MSNLYDYEKGPLTIRVPSALDERIGEIALRTGRSRPYVWRQILRHLLDNPTHSYDFATAGRLRTSHGLTRRNVPVTREDGAAFERLLEATGRKGRYGYGRSLFLTAAALDWLKSQKEPGLEALS